MRYSLKRLMAIASLVFFLPAALLPAHAGIVTGQSAQQSETAQQGDRAKVEAWLQRQDVQQKMLELGVDPVQAQARIANLTDSELAYLQDNIENAPAGAGALAVIGAVFLVLLILELVGVIDVFKRT